jgi:3-oxoacyl-[acyl-carrier-protein] synthase II
MGAVVSIKASSGAIVVTGLGAVSPAGVGIGELWRTLCNGDRKPVPVRHFDTSEARVRTAFTVPGEESLAGSSDRSLDLLIRAAQQAIDDSGAIVGDDVGLLVASTENIGQDFGRATRQSALAGWLALGPSVVNKASSALGVEGPSLFVNSASASGAVALGVAREMINADEITAAIVVAADAVVETAFMGLDSLRILSPDGCRPFSSKRSGIAVSEAGCALFVESMARTARRDDVGFGRIIGYGCSNRSTHMTASDAEGICRAISVALADAGLDPEAIDFVNAHGTGTRQGDAAEVGALRQVFGKHFSQVAVLSSKGAIGHCQGAAGLIEALAVILSLQYKALPVSQHSYPVDDTWPDIDVTVSERAVPTLRRGVTVSCGLGGVHTALVVERGGEG